MSGIVRRTVRRLTPSGARRRIRRLLRGGTQTTPTRASSTKASPTEIDRIYSEAQTATPFEVPATDSDLDDLAAAWQDDEIPELQRRVVDVQLANLERGIADPVFTALATALTHVDLASFSILDTACASGYYSEVIRLLDPRPIAYEGCDYSPAMIESARAHNPGVPFSVEDLTALTKPDRSFDVVLLAGVLEHIPEYQKAIAEAGRVARSYLIVHRSPMLSGPDHIRTIGTQYNIKTPRTFFSLARLESEIAQVGFEPIASIDVYPTKRPASARRHAGDGPDADPGLPTPTDRVVSPERRIDRGGLVTDDRQARTRRTRA